MTECKLGSRVGVRRDPVSAGELPRELVGDCFLVVVEVGWFAGDESIDDLVGETGLLADGSVGVELGCRRSS